MATTAIPKPAQAINTAFDAAQSLRAALHSQPEALRRQLAQISASIGTLSLTHYRLHIRNHHCVEDVTEQLSAAGTASEAVSQTLTHMREDWDELEGGLQALAAEHGRLRRTIAQQNTLSELLDAPTLADTCVRAGMYEEALDISEYASALFFAHRLWADDERGDGRGAARVQELGDRAGAGSPRAGMAPAAPSPLTVVSESIAHGPGPASAHAQGASALIRHIVERVREACSELRIAILSQLSGTGKVALPLALRLLGSLRRLYTQEALEQKRIYALRNASTAEPSATGRTPDLTADASYALTVDEDLEIVNRVRVDYLECRNAWHAAELDALPRSNPVTYLSRVTDLQRSHWADIASQYVAVCATIRPSEFTMSSMDATAKSAVLQRDQVGSRALLAEWLMNRIDWFEGSLQEQLQYVDDGAQLATMLQQMTFAGRRAGRLGADYTHRLPSIFQARIRTMFAERVAAASTSFAESTQAWQWAYKLGYDPEHAAPSKDAEGAADLAPPTAVLRFAPLAELLNNVILAFNAVRPCMPVDGVVWLRSEICGMLLAAASALHDAATSDASPAVRAAAARSRAKAASSSHAPGATALSDDDNRAAQRFNAMCTATVEVFAPYILSILARFQAAAHAVAIARGTAQRAASSQPVQAWQAIAEKRTCNDAELDEAWSASRIKVTDATKRLQELLA